jgi:uncharacterized protein (DUF58 family)
VRSFGLNLKGRAGASASGPATVRQRAEETAARLPALLVAAERVAATVAQGVHGRRRVGQGETFWQFRQYQQGDPVSRIDWRQSAKRDQTYIRENEWAAAQSVWLWLDQSESMSYRSNDSLPHKGDRAALLTLALSSLLVRGGERIALLGSGIAPTTGKAVLERFASVLTTKGRATQSLPQTESLPRYSRIVLISDFLSPPGDIEKALKRLTGVGIRGHMLQIIDPAEESLPFSGRVRFEGLEGEGAALIGRVEAVRNEYMVLMESHRAAVKDIARGLGWTWTTHSTDNPPPTALLTLYQLLSEPPGNT